MKLIAHRGLYKGPDKNLENRPYQIRSALDRSFDCEIDLWVFEDRLYLGHDGPQYNITEEFIQQMGLWIHCKNLAALEYCQFKQGLNFFWHESDSYTVTSSGYIWCYPEKELAKNSVMLMPEWADPNFEKIPGVNCYAICSDYVEQLKEIISTAQSR
jgi:hypothetical protein